MLQVIEQVPGWRLPPVFGGTEVETGSIAYCEEYGCRLGLVYAVSLVVSAKSGLHWRCRLAGHWVDGPSGLRDLRRGRT